MADPTGEADSGALTEWLTRPVNLAVLADLPERWNPPTLAKPIGCAPIASMCLVDTSYRLT
jgi:hypothetical protein